MSEQRSSLSVLGGPRSGKSTYLGALGNAMEAGRTDLVRLPTELPDDTRALNRLVDDVAGGNYPQRTNPDERHDLTFALELSRPIDGIERFTAQVSDYNGEEIESLYRYRTSGWSQEWKQRAQASGILLFVRHSVVEALPQIPGPPPSEEARWRALIDQDNTRKVRRTTAPVKALPQSPQELFGADLLEDDGAERPPAAIDTPVRVPTELSVIELLQFIRDVRGLAPGERPSRAEAFRVAVMLSAWDAVDKRWQRTGPMGFLRESLPLLHDFLWSNFRLDRDVQCFGLSSTGGDLTDASFKKRYIRDRGHPGQVDWTDNFGRVQHAKDLALPLLWALLGDAVFAHAHNDHR